MKQLGLVAPEHRISVSRYVLIGWPPPSPLGPEAHASLLKHCSHLTFSLYMSIWVRGGSPWHEGWNFHAVPHELFSQFYESPPFQKAQIPASPVCLPLQVAVFGRSGINMGSRSTGKNFCSKNCISVSDLHTSHQNSASTCSTTGCTQKSSSLTLLRARTVYKTADASLINLRVIPF